MTRSEINAFADGHSVYISSGLLRFAQSDQELAMVISHEIAHNVMEHQKAQRKNASWGALLDIVAATAGVYGNSFSSAAASLYSKEFEAEADYVGLYLMAHAGMNVDHAAGFWRRVAAENPRSIRASYNAITPATRRVPSGSSPSRRPAQRSNRNRQTISPLIPNPKLIRQRHELENRTRHPSGSGL